MYSYYVKMPSFNMSTVRSGHTLLVNYLRTHFMVWYSSGTTMYENFDSKLINSRTIIIIITSQRVVKQTLSRALITRA